MLCGSGISTFFPSGVALSVCEGSKDAPSTFAGSSVEVGRVLSFLEQCRFCCSCFGARAVPAKEEFLSAYHGFRSCFGVRAVPAKVAGASLLPSWSLGFFFCFWIFQGGRHFAVTPYPCARGSRDALRQRNLYFFPFRRRLVRVRGELDAPPTLLCPVFIRFPWHRVLCLPCGLGCACGQCWCRLQA